MSQKQLKEDSEESATEDYKEWKRRILENALKAKQANAWKLIWNSLLFIYYERVSWLSWLRGKVLTSLGMWSVKMLYTVLSSEAGALVFFECERWWAGTNLLRKHKVAPYLSYFSFWRRLTERGVYFLSLFIVSTMVILCYKQAWYVFYSIQYIDLSAPQWPCMRFTLKRILLCCCWSMCWICTVLRWTFCGVFKTANYNFPHFAKSQFMVDYRQSYQLALSTVFI